MSKSIAYLAPEIPSVSATFVYREILELRKLGARVVPFSMHTCSGSELPAEARQFLRETHVLYGKPLAGLKSALGFVCRHPQRALKTVGLALRDTLRGRFCDLGTRLKVPLQAVAALDLANRLEAAAVGHLHIHFAHAPCTLGMYAAHAAGIPFSVTAHANDIFQRPAMLEEKIQRARPFVTISRANRRRLGMHYPGTAGAIRVVRCGVPTLKYRVRGEHEKSLRPVLMSVGRLVPKKGTAVLLEALSKVVPHFPDVQLQLVGDGPERTALEALVSHLRIEKNVVFCSALDTDQIQEMLGKTWGFALACRMDDQGDMDGIPVVLMEAMARGVPVVSTRLSGVPELIEHGKSGLLADPDDAEGLALAIRRLLTERALAEELGAAGRDRVVSEFDSRHGASKLLSLIVATGETVAPVRFEASSVVVRGTHLPQIKGLTVPDLGLGVMTAACESA